MENSQVGPFKILHKLGSHRRHNVYLARQVEQGREVALKFISLPPDVDRNKAIVKIEREIIVLRKLSHPNLVKVYGAGVHGDRVFIACEVVPGETLSSLLVRRGRLAPDQVVDYARQIARALQYLHEQEILHSKLNSDKILISPDSVIKVADLRLNRSRKRRWDAARRAQLETAAYLAPEQLVENGATAKSDLYSLGVLMFEMLTGRLPYEPETMAQLVRDKQETKAPAVSSLVMNCPGWLSKLVAGLLEANPQRRPHSAKAIELTLEQIRSVEQQKKTAAEEMTGGFSALTAGADRREANRLMGIKKQVRPEDAKPLLQSTPFLAGCLLLIVIVVAFFLIPTPPSKLIQRADQLMQSADQRDWVRARSIYQQVMASNAPKEIADRAEEQYYLIRRRMLVQRADAGPVGLEKLVVREFYVAYQTQKNREFGEALRLYEELVASVDPEGDDRYVFLESESRRDSLAAEKVVADENKEHLDAELLRADRLVEDEQTSQAAQIYFDIVREFGHNGFLMDQVRKAEEALAALELETGGPNKLGQYDPQKKTKPDDGQ